MFGVASSKEPELSPATPGGSHARFSNECKKPSDLLLATRIKCIETTGTQAGTDQKGIKITPDLATLNFHNMLYSYSYSYLVVCAGVNSWDDGLGE